MAPKTARHTILSEITPFDDESGDLRIVIETPKGSRNKYSYDPDCDCLQLSTVLLEGMVFPYDFGFIPSTLGRRRRSFGHFDFDGSVRRARVRRTDASHRWHRSQAKRKG